MSRSRMTSGVDYVATFFANNRLNSRLLSAVLKNRDNSLLLEDLNLPSDFVLPFVREERGGSIVYSLKHGENKAYEVMLHDYPCEDRIIQSGDYFTFRNCHNGQTIHVLFIATSDIAPAYKKYMFPKDANVFIGRSSSNDIVYGFSGYVSRDKHAVIRIDNNRAFVENLNPKVGLYVNGYRSDSQQLKPFDEIYLMGLSIIYMGDFLAVRNLKTECTLLSKTAYREKIAIQTEEKKPFVSTPRILKSLDIEEIEIDAPPSPFIADKTPAILTIGPSLTMSLAMLASLGVSITNAINGGELSTIIVSGTMAAGMLLGSLMWPSLLRQYQKKRIAAEEYHRKTRYISYISDIEKELVVKKDRTIRLLNDSLCPSPDILCSMLDNDRNKLRLWERSDEDEDFLAIRMGLGSRPFGIQLKTPKQGFQLYEDELRNLPVELTKKYGVLNDVPMTLDFFHNRTIGVIGDQDHIQSILCETILNIIALHSSEEVKLILIAPPKQAHYFEIFKNVPHIWSNDKKVRFFASNPDEVHYVFNILNDVFKQRDSANHLVKSIPHYVVIATEPNLIEKEALLRYLNDAENQVGVTTLFAYGDITKLPKSCKTIILSDDSRTGYYIKNKNANRFIEFTLDKLNTDHVYSFVNKLSQLPIKRDLRSLGIADRVSFLQMYKAGNVEELNIEAHWENNNSAKSLAAPIGVMAGGEVFSLDLHEAYHGCHGLIAGTTGSGKSEFLQALILSLAINYSPREVAFVLIDFKGDETAKPFMAKTDAPAFPHLSATASNLSGNILYRALVSLKAELNKRQRIFNKSKDILGVDKLDINSYHKYYKDGRLEQPLPHLVVIIDEFAQLKTQYPEFIEQLINVAQIGRSLGIHLILAAQKPSSIVDAQIMSNSRFKICLKVAEKQDSIDMINKPDAAMIKNPGRMYLQVGYDEIYECIQAGYSGAEYVPTETYMPDEEITVRMTDNTANPIHSAKMDMAGEKSNKTQIEAIIAAIVALGQKKGIKAEPLWKDILPEKIVLDTLDVGKKGLCTATVGLADCVWEQDQWPLNIDFTEIGHIGVYGASGSGKTTFLQTLVYSMVCDYGYTPEELNLYALDFGGRNLGYLSELPHTGGVVFDDEEEKLTALSSVLQDLIAERKRIFADNNCSTFADYHIIRKKTNHQKPLPAVLILIDNFSSLRDQYTDISDEFIDILRSCNAFGVYFIITGSTRDAFPYKATDHISCYFTLKMNDPSDYRDIHKVRSLLAPEDICGRGVTVINKELVEFQTAIAFDGETEADRIVEISQKYVDLAQSWDGDRPIKIDIHENYSNETNGSDGSDGFKETIQESNPPEAVWDDVNHLVLGTSMSGILQYGLTLSDDYRVSVCADDTNQLRVFYKNLLESMGKYIDRQIVFFDDSNGTFKDIATEYASCQYVQNIADFDVLIKMLDDDLKSRLEQTEQKYKQLFFVISEFNDFFAMITDEQADFMRNMFSDINDPKYNVYFVCGFNVNGSKNNDRLFMELIVKAKNYVFCSDSYEKAARKIENLPVTTQTKKGGCWFCMNENSVEIRW